MFTILSAIFSRYKIWFLVAGLIFLILGSCYFYYTSTQNKIQALIHDKVVAESNYNIAKDANDKNLETISNLQTSYSNIQKEYQSIQNDLQITRMQRDELLGKLDHNFDAIALAQPKYLETLLNKGTKNATRCFELLSGSPLNNIELSAKNEKDFNSECPWLYEKLKVNK